MITSTVAGTGLDPIDAPMDAPVSVGGVNVALSPRMITPHKTAIMHVQGGFSANNNSSRNPTG